MGRERVGKYKLKETIGIGSFGKVKRAINTETRGTVAIKIMNKKKIRKQAGLVELVRQEVAHMKLLPVHEHIITLLEVFESDTHIYLVMECATRGELYQRILSDGPCSDKIARKYWQQLLSGLEYVHSQKICHRDLKLENLLLDPNDVLKISDFGLSVLRKEYHNHRELMAIAGTPNYIAPEIIAGRGYDGFLADIWSAGVCLYGILAGYLPFDTGKNVKKLFQIISQGEVTYPKRFTDDAVDLLTGIFKTNPKERFTLKDCIAHRWTNNGRELDPSVVGSRQEVISFDTHELSEVIIHYEETQLAEAVKEIKTPSPTCGDTEELYLSTESYDQIEDEIDDLERAVSEHTGPRLDVIPAMFPARSREPQRLSPGKSMSKSEASTHPSNGDLSTDLKLVHSLSHDDGFDLDSDAEEIDEDLSTDFTDSEEESESSHSGGSGPADLDAFQLLSMAHSNAFTSLLSNDRKSKSKPTQVMTCFHSNLAPGPLFELVEASVRSMDGVRLKVIPQRFLIKVRITPPRQKSIRVNIEIKETIGNSTVVGCHRLKGTISSYQAWYEQFMSIYSKLSKNNISKSKKSNFSKKHRRKEEVSPPVT